MSKASTSIVAFAACLACSEPTTTSEPTPTPIAEPTISGTTTDLEELHAFTKLYGYVRFFHPSDEAAAADWDVGSSRVDLQACKLEYSIVSPK